MINYPNGKKNTGFSALKSAANRGMSLEEDLNATNDYYLALKKANIHKKPTPVQIVHVDYPKRTAAKITEAYFKVPSTTDYNGVYRGRAIDFEAKECSSRTSFPFSSIHPHQIEHLDSVLYHGAIAFLIVRFNCFDETYLVDARKIIDQYRNSARRSLPYTWFQKEGILIPFKLNPPVDYLRIVDAIHFKGEPL